MTNRLTRGGGAPANGGDPLVPATDRALLEVTDLDIEFETATGTVNVVTDLNLRIRHGEVVGLVGESGSGKSITAMSLLRLLPEQARISGGRVEFDGIDLVRAGPAQLRTLRGARIAMIFQDPFTSLNPLMTVGTQLVEAIRLHAQTVSRHEARERSGELLGRIGLADPARLMRAYPHELSGGMRQRAVIAMAMVNGPELLVADEPTTALDVTTQAQVLDTLQNAREQAGSAMLLISHDLGVIADHADRIYVMYHGRVVESGSTTDLLSAPRHPYTAALLASRPSLTRRSRLRPIPGVPAPPLQRPQGCAFAPRCHVTTMGDATAHEICLAELPVLAEVGSRGGRSACHFPTDAVTPEIEAEEIHTPAAEPSSEAALLSVADLVKEFSVRHGIGLRRSPRVRAVDSVSFDVTAGRSVALVGESGSGKSTTAGAVLRLIEPTSGRVLFDGRDVQGMRGDELRRFRQEVQLVQQDPYSALNPRMTVEETLSEPLRVHRVVPPEQVRREVERLLDTVGLRPEHARRFPHEFSGGQRQRVCIARALSLRPKLLVLDEPVSSLDVSVQAQILNLLADIQRERGLAYLVITHDLAVVRAVADDIVVLHKGAVVESGTAGHVLDAPQHPYTRALLAAVPDSGRVRERAVPDIPQRERLVPVATGDTP